MKRIWRVLPLIVLAVALAGCSATQQTNGTPPPAATTEQAEAQAWAKAVDYFGTIETARHAGNQLALTLSRQNKIPIDVLETFVKVDKAAIAANQLLQASPNNFSKPIATQVALLAGQILTELSQWDALPAVTVQPKLVESIRTMEAAAEKVQVIQ